MKRYIVTVTSYAELSVVVEVEADDEDDAREKALELDDYDWDVTEHTQHRTTEEVEEAE